MFWLGSKCVTLWLAALLLFFYIAVYFNNAKNTFSKMWNAERRGRTTCSKNKAKKRQPPLPFMETTVEFCTHTHITLSQCEREWRYGCVLHSKVWCSAKLCRATQKGITFTKNIILRLFYFGTSYLLGIFCTTLLLKYTERFASRAPRKKLTEPAAAATTTTRKWKRSTPKMLFFLPFFGWPKHCERKRYVQTHSSHCQSEKE